MKFDFFFLEWSHFQEKLRVYYKIEYIILKNKLNNSFNFKNNLLILMFFLI